ncbi:hypothetical protein FQN52_004327 [Onygenales sp. PD_12]|nr:hypothetical protein FQN53_000848 [Emmonsiellopsis sp. PD_33]KAK2791886.1 hypothetical protein FQN52_004327 [Onygenales sp. PD_12]
MCLHHHPNYLHHHHHHHHIIHHRGHNSICSWLPDALLTQPHHRDFSIGLDRGQCRPLIGCGAGPRLAVGVPEPDGQPQKNLRRYEYDGGLFNVGSAKLHLRPSSRCSGGSPFDWAATKRPWKDSCKRWPNRHTCPSLCSGPVSLRPQGFINPPSVSQQASSSHPPPLIGLRSLAHSFPSDPFVRPIGPTQQVCNPSSPSLSFSLYRTTSTVLKSFGRLVGSLAVSFAFFMAGAALSPKMRETMSNVPTDEASNSLYVAPEDVTREIDEFIDQHPLAASLREDARFSESRPHMKIPPALRERNFTAGTLSGPNKIAVPPYVWSEAGGKSLVAMLYLGSDVSGHPGLVHGGLLATILDESLARCCFPALPNGIGVTANLNIDYRSPAPAGSFFVLRAETTKVEGRKAWVEGRIETLPDDGQEPVVVAEAKALFIEPKHAAVLAPLYKMT